MKGQQRQTQDTHLETFCRDREEKRYLVMYVERQQALPELGFLFFSICLFQQALSCSLLARGRERFFPLPLSPRPAPHTYGDEQQACDTATSGLPMPSSHSGPNLDPLHVRNFY